MLPEKAGNAMASVAAATYAVAFKDPEKSFAGCQSAVDGLLSKKELWITKETKRSTARSIFGPVFMTVTLTTARWYLW